MSLKLPPSSLPALIATPSPTATPARTGRRTLLATGLGLATGAVLPTWLGAAGGTAQAQATNPSGTHPFSRVLDLQGHRGTRGLAPENTLAAFERALRVGVSTLELDVGVTADGVVVMSHDPHLNPAFTRDAQGQWLDETGPLIHSLKLAELQRYDVGRARPGSAYAKAWPQQQPRDGERVPTLAAVFELAQRIAPPEVRFNIETKIFPKRPGDTTSPEDMVARLLDAVRSGGLTHRVSIQSFDWRTLRLVQRREAAIPTVYLSVQSETNDTIADGAWTAGYKLADHASVAHMVKAAGGKVWSPNYRDINPSILATARSLGLQIIPWTVNDPVDLRRMLDWQVDGIITDYPDRLRALLRERGMPLPRAASATAPHAAGS